jgi:hypothetical protein
LLTSVAVAMLVATPADARKKTTQIPEENGGKK